MQLGTWPNINHLNKVNKKDNLYRLFHFSHSKSENESFLGVFQSTYIRRLKGVSDFIKKE